MGRTLPSITNAFLDEQQSLAPFRRALPLTDQRALDDLFGASRHHLAAAAYASHLLPFEIMLLSMLVEEHKQVLHLQLELERLDLLLGLDRASHPGGDRASHPGGDPEGDPAAFPHAPTDAPDSGMEDHQDTLALLPDRRAPHEAPPSSYLPRPEPQPRATGGSSEGPALSPSTSLGAGSVEGEAQAGGIPRPLVEHLTESRGGESDKGAPAGDAAAGG